MPSILRARPEVDTQFGARVAYTAVAVGATVAIAAETLYIPKSTTVSCVIAGSLIGGAFPIFFDRSIPWQHKVTPACLLLSASIASFVNGYGLM